MPTISSSLRFLALGDSYTIGTSVNAVESWPHLLVDRLISDGIFISPPEIIAQNGWTTVDLTTGIAEAAPQGPYDLVTLLIGVNDQFDVCPIEAYHAGFLGLLEDAVYFAGGDPSKVIVLSIPDWGVTPFAKGRDSNQIATEIDRFNDFNREESTAAGVHYVNVTSLSRLFGDDPEFLAPDGLHPSGRMYAIWVEILLPIVIDIISAQADNSSI